jgi:membrane protease YdiL (CAAX protease family)
MIAAPRNDLSSRLVAPLWHTGLLLSLFIGLAAGGALFQSHLQQAPGALQQHPNAVPLYVSILALEWGLFAFVTSGLRKTGTAPLQVIGGRWSSTRAVLVDFGLGFGTWAVWAVIEMIWDRLFGAGHAAAVETVLRPHGALEILLWVAVSCSAGICEELTFRSYLQRQFTALLHSRALAVLLQAAIFGIGHGYQGLEACSKIALFGALFGVLSLWRRSLRPGMVAHAWTDIASGIFGI